MTTADGKERGERENMIEGYDIYATTDNEMQAAAIALRLIQEEGRDATTRDIADLETEGYAIRSAYRYAVLAVPLSEVRNA